MQYKRLNETNLSNKTVLLRLDLNTPVENSLVVNNERILRSLPTINFIIDAGAKLVIMSHLGRPEENDIFQEEFSLLPVVNEMESLLNKKIMYYDNDKWETWTKTEIENFVYKIHHKIMQQILVWQQENSVLLEYKDSTQQWFHGLLKKVTTRKSFSPDKVKKRLISIFNLKNIEKINHIYIYEFIH